MSPRLRSRFAGLGVAALAVIATTAGLAGCGSPAQRSAPVSAASPAAAPSPAVAATQPVAPLRHRLRADVLVTATKPLPADVVRKLDKLHVTAGATTIEVGSIRLNGQPVHAVAADPSQFRTFAPPGTAESTGVWDAVARGEAVVAHATARRLKLTLGGTVSVTSLAHGGVVQYLRVGAFATTLPDAEIVVGESIARSLGLHPSTGLVLSAGKGDPASLANAVRAVVGARGQIDLLSAPAANPTAFLTGSRAAGAFGAFSYRYFPDGTIQPDAGWVAANIRTESVPILGTLTCHRLMFSQLRHALAEIQARGLAGKIHSADGCYVPRFIERNPHNSISLHTWGIAIDINAAENPVNHASSQDPTVVAIFKKWGYTWGGDWGSPKDPMHFQIGALLG